MNIILLESSDWLDKEIVRLTDRRLRHLTQVLKAQPGDFLRVGALHGMRGRGEVLSMDEREAHLRVTLDQPAPERHPCNIVLSLPRPKMLRRILRTAAEMGVAELHLIHSARVEKSFWQSPLLAPDQINASLCAGLERAGDTHPPSVHLHKRFRPFVEDQLPALMNKRPCWIAHPGAAASLSAQRGIGMVMLGPEGGFIPFEVELARSVGALPVNLGERTLSVDTAVTCALSQTAAHEES
jgi:16S rRNA (uracil1498-N3)-methyltransferase